MKTVWPGVLFSAFLGAVLAADNCDWKESPVSKTAKPITIEAVNALPTNITVSEILKRLGPAARDVGSGLIVLQWDLPNGKVFSVSTTSLCASPIGGGIRERK